MHYGDELIDVVSKSKKLTAHFKGMPHKSIQAITYVWMEEIKAETKGLGCFDTWRYLTWNNHKEKRKNNLRSLKYFFALKLFY